MLMLTRPVRPRSRARLDNATSGCCNQLEGCFTG